MLEQLVEALQGHHICCHQLALTLDCWSAGKYMRTRYGSYRVELVVRLFSRLLDLHNFEFVLERLTTIEHACLIVRCGWLNLYNPWKVKTKPFLLSLCFALLQSLTF